MLRFVPRANGAQGFDRPEGMPELIHTLLCARGVTSLSDAERFLNPSWDQLHPPALLSGMAETVQLIQQARDAHWPVCVYGDYDVDGVSATAILLTAFRELGIEARHHIPSRHEDGYGIHEAAVREIAKWAKLLISVDCGVTAVPQVALARELGLQVAVTDHHRPTGELPDCPVVNPLLNDYPCPFLCGAGVAFKLVQALDPALAERLIDLAALATVADVVSLQGENRVIVALGLARMREHPRPGLAALARGAGIEMAGISARGLAFQLAPRLNAGGRLGNAERALNLLLAEDAEHARPLAEILESENAARRQVETSILRDAKARMRDFDFVHRRSIVLHGDDWNAGVIGLAASRLVEAYNLPCVLLAGAGDELQGSCRSIPDVDIHAALQGVSSLMIRFGGHRQAAGLSLSRANLPAFREALDTVIANSTDPSCFLPRAAYDAEADLSEIDDRLVSLTQRLEPFGFGNPAPVFLSTARIRKPRRVGADGAHLQLMAADGGSQARAIGFGMGTSPVMDGETRRLLYTPKMHSWNQITDIQLELKAMEPLDPLTALAESATMLEGMLPSFLTERLYNNRACSVDWALDRRTGLDESLRSLADSLCGTLVVATDPNALKAFLLAARDVDLDERFDLCIGRWPQGTMPRNAVCLLPTGKPPQNYPSIYLLDAPGALFPEFTKPLELDTGRAAWLGMLPDKDTLRSLYRLVRDLDNRPYFAKTKGAILRTLAEDGALDPAQVAAGLPVLSSMRLIEYQTEPPLVRLLPMHKADPEDCELFQFLRALAAWKEVNPA